MDIKLLDRLKRLAIIAMFSDDDLMEMLVLKGGNLLDTIYNIASRASVDVDFSMEGEFQEEDFELIKEKIQRALVGTFEAEGFTVFDLNLLKRPKKDLPSVTCAFWGGYRLEFKVIESSKYEKLKHDQRSLRMGSVTLGKNHERKFIIDISKFEYCAPKREMDLDEGYTIYVYTPEMIVFEKIRAICQQMPEYDAVVPSSGKSARARDFFDIYTILEHYEIDFMAEDNLVLLQNIFVAKKVPLWLIGRIQEYMEFHRPDFASVRDTVKAGTELRDFDFYFNYVIERCAPLKTLWEI